LEGGDEVYSIGWPCTLVVTMFSALHTPMLKGYSATHAKAGALRARDFSQNILDLRVRNGMEFSRILNSVTPAMTDKANPNFPEQNRVHA
jgi:hypothetical protein